MDFSIFFLAVFLLVGVWSTTMRQKKLASDERITLAISGSKGPNFIIDIKLDPISVTSYYQDPVEDDSDGGTYGPDGGVLSSSGIENSQNTGGSTSQSGSGTEPNTEINSNRVASSPPNSSGSTTSGPEQNRASRTRSRNTGKLNQNTNDDSLPPNGNSDTNTVAETDDSSASDGRDSESTIDKDDSLSVGAKVSSSNNLHGGENSISNAKDTSTGKSFPSTTNTGSDKVDNSRNSNELSGDVGNEPPSKPNTLQSSLNSGKSVLDGVTTSKDSSLASVDPKPNENSGPLATGKASDETRSSEDTDGTIPLVMSTKSGKDSSESLPSNVKDGSKRSGRFGKKQL